MSGPRFNVDTSTVLVLGVAGAAVLAALYVARIGVREAAEGVAGAAVDVVAGVAAGVADAAQDTVVEGVTTASEAVGLPTPAQTTTDPRVARWIIDNIGHYQASLWSSAWALVQAEFSAAGTGTPPPAGTAAAQRFAAEIAAAATRPATVDAGVDWWGWGF